MELIIGSSNQHKINEISSIFNDVGIKVLSLKDFHDVPEIKETENDFMANAELKAKTLAALFNKPVLSDDSGLCVKMLDDMPGIYSARYSGLGDAANNQKILDSMKQHEDRSAYFVCALALVFPDGKVFRYMAHFKGLIATEPRGRQGFGYDPIFYVESLKKTVGELDPQIKNQISHRAKALKIMKENIDEIINYWRYSWQK